MGGSVSRCHGRIGAGRQRGCAERVAELAYRAGGCGGEADRATCSPERAEGDPKERDLLAGAPGCGLDGVQPGRRDAALERDPVKGEVEACRRDEVVVRECDCLLAFRGEVVQFGGVGEGQVPVVGARPGGARSVVSEQPHVAERLQLPVNRSIYAHQPGGTSGRNWLGLPCQEITSESRARVAATKSSERACLISRW